MIKPHIIHNRQLGNVIDDILNIGGFEISAMEMLYLNKNNAAEFFEVYKGVMPEFNLMTDYLCSSGPVVVMEVRQDDCVQKLRKFCGPHDPVEAKGYNPESLRAKYGIDKIKNAVHCTDLVEDGLLECEYFFVLL